MSENSFSRANITGKQALHFRSNSLSSALNTDLLDASIDFITGFLFSLRPL